MRRANLARWKLPTASQSRETHHFIVGLDRIGGILICLHITVNTSTCPVSQGIMKRLRPIATSFPYCSTCCCHPSRSSAAPHSFVELLHAAADATVRLLPRDPCKAINRSCAAKAWSYVIARCLSFLTDDAPSLPRAHSSSSSSTQEPVVTRRLAPGPGG